MTGEPVPHDVTRDFGLEPIRTGEEMDGSVSPRGVKVV